MSDVVLDASVVIKWFAPSEEVSFRQARMVRDRYTAGELIVTVPPLLFLEILNVAGRRWSWPEPDLLELAVRLKEGSFEIADADLEDLTPWIAMGLSSYDAAYVALAESRGIPLITDDARIVEIAGPIATPLTELT